MIVYTILRYANNSNGVQKEEEEVKENGEDEEPGARTSLPLQHTWYT